MVNSKVIRGGGLIVLAGSYVLLERSFTNDVVGAAKTMFGNLIGGGRGSMYNVSLPLLSLTPLPLALPTLIYLHLLLRQTCDGDSKTLQKLTSVNLADKAATDLKYNFYSIDNPKEYLGGSDAVVVEQGPYNLR